MVFTPDTKEMDLLSKIISIHHAEYSLIRLTSTMLEKSIIDAGEGMRNLFKENEIIDYSSITPGGDKIILDAILLSDEAYPVQISCYRPKTKKGDPRFWIYGLKKIIRKGELIYITIYNNQVCIIPLVSHYFNIGEISNFFKNDDSSNINDCINILKKLAHQDILSVSPYKLNPKDIGDTLEREFDIPSNSSKLADFRGLIELKAKRKGVKTKDTLFSMVPNWNESNIQTSTDMILTFGYKSRKHDDFIDLYVTVSNKPNAQGLYLEVDEDNQVVIQKYKDSNGSVSDTCIWTFDELKERLYSKHPETLWVIGKKVDKHDEIYFNYESVEHTCSPIFSSFLLLISQGIITYDWRGRVKPDRSGYKDKGHCFRLKPKYRHLLFGQTEEIKL